ncbi:BioY-domain-containing protein [Anaeromyces robustus]|jgi:biotin transporter BioY|uniref:BioY-domain-containing protein n=1 Tax=Anaeromyces robustus TaxID=1754192 RepID=A0A1Y1XDR0_9FUNG|nr:BioY-domain-containing protein [Anaeromyces robustus]|eukprot:ORX83921.1 BioY-domain-containing protein [Anaeromyces robustus]
MSTTQTVYISPSYSSTVLSCSTSQRSTVGQLRNRISKQYLGIVDNSENIIFEDEEKKCLLDDNTILKDKQKINLSLRNYPTYTSALSKNISNYFDLRNKDKYDTEAKKGKFSTSFIINSIFILIGTVFISIFAQISFNLPINKEVPITFQTFAVLLNGAVQSPLNSCLSCILYLIVGCAGLPVFADFGHGISSLTGYSGGFLVGFIFSSIIVGFLSKRGWDKQYRKIWLSMIIGNLVIYVFGFSWFAYKTKSFWGSFPKVVFPFIPGDLIKILLASLFVPLGWKIFYFRNKKLELDIEDHE